MQPVLPRRPAVHQWLPVWKEYKRTGDVKLRDRLIFTYAPMVKYIVHAKAKEVPARCELSDLVSCGMEALMHSIERYDPTKGPTLEQYAWTRIHGTILDELRRQDWAPRSVRRWERDIREAEQRFLVLYNRTATSEELASAMGVSVDELRKWQHDIRNASTTSLHSLVMADDESAVELVETLPGKDATTDPEQATVAQVGKERFREVFQTLPERERQVAILLYVHDLTMREVGQVLGVTESRISQLHSGLKKQIRERLERSDQGALFRAIA
jgi:RNA polymerase sigma factor for flagellar operon FliA